jgi:hypothetical protein
MQKERYPKTNKKSLNHHPKTFSTSILYKMDYSKIGLPKSRKKLVLGLCRHRTTQNFKAKPQKKAVSCDIF